jgi:glycosyltransferase involved in cell wall biosynthesis
MLVSIIIPTYNRVKELEETLDSIISQTTLPKEILIVDDSDNDEIVNLVEYRKTEFKEKDLLLKYLRNKKEKSLTIARNIGIENATGDVILFLDDDVVLDKEYINEILKVYEAYPNALGVQGYITNIVLSKFWNRINKILFRGYLEKDKCRVLPSTNSTYPYLLDKVISCQWLSGSNQSYMREVFQSFRYNENLKRYSYSEDADLSCQVHKHYPNSLYITPYAKLIHKASEEEKLPNKMLIQMKHIYKLYFFYNHLDQNIKNKIIFIWSWLGCLIMNTSISILSLVIRGSKSGLVTVKYTIGAYVTCMKHLKEIKKGDLEFFNKGLR